MKIPGKKRRSRRLRKKLRIGEFQHLGFCFKAEIDEMSSDQMDTFMDAMVHEAVDARGLAMGGSATGAFICSMFGATATEEDREAIRAWLTARPEVKLVRIGPLVDAWYPPNDYDSIPL